MAEKKSDATPGMKLLGLYWLMLFSRRPYSLSQLAEKLECSKPTVLRQMTQIESSGYANVSTWIGDDRQRWFQIVPPQDRPLPSLSDQDISNLVLCRDMVAHLLPKSLAKAVGRALVQAAGESADSAQAPEMKQRLARPVTKGGIDYSRQGEVLEVLRLGLRENRACSLVYRSPGGKERRHRVAPLELLPYREALYLRGRLLGRADEPLTTLALHRIASAKITDQRFDREALSEGLGGPGAFGLIQDEPFRVRVAFQPGAAHYVRERVWSDDQSLEPQEDGGVVMEFTATSREEVVSWVLGFGAEARVLAPQDLASTMAEIAGEVARLYA